MVKGNWKWESKGGGHCLQRPVSWSRERGEELEGQEDESTQPHLLVHCGGGGCSQQGEEVSPSIQLISRELAATCLEIRDADKDGRLTRANML